MMSRAMRGGCAAILALLGACSPGIVGAGADAHGDAAARDADGALRDANTGLDVASPGDVTQPRDVLAMPDVPPPPCDSRFTITPSVVGDDAPFGVAFTDTPGYVYIDLALSGPGAPVAAWGGVSGTPHVWRYTVSGHAAGRLTMRFTADMGATTIATCMLDVQARGGVDAGPPDSGPVDSGPAVPPSANRFGIGLVGPGNTAQLDLAANLAGPGGYVKLIFAGVRPGMTGPDPSWVDSVRNAYARDLIPVIRFGPDWADRRVRNQSDAGSAGRSYTQLASAYRAIVQGLPLRAAWPIYIEVHNEPNLCYEWQCDAGAFPGGQITVAQMSAEYASLVRDVATALHAIGDARIRVINAGIAPGGVRWCACVGTRDAGAGEWEGGTTSLDFIAGMRAAVPDVMTRLDGWASHSYPAEGEGWGFWVPYARANTGLRYYRRELAAAGVSLPVFMTETGWPTDHGGTTYCTRDEQASWTDSAYRDVWLVDPEVRAVMPFELQDSAWAGFSWVRDDGSAYPVYTTIRALRCSRTPGRCP